MFACRLVTYLTALAVLGLGCEASEGTGDPTAMTPAPPEGDSVAPMAGGETNKDQSAATDQDSMTMQTMGNTEAPTGDAMPMAAAGGAMSPPADGSTDYSVPANWLCRPGHNAACEMSLDTTIVAPDGTMTMEAFEPHPDPPVDCFYVYPTVSLDETPNSDLVPGPEEESVVRAQFARLASQCRLFAPMYRQVSLTALRASIAGTGGGGTPDRQLGYGDVLGAWQYYLENDNGGRGVVLVGHSQGSSVLTQLIKSELDTAPLDDRFLAAMLIGSTVRVPEGGAVGGTFENVPLCESADQLGCIITYASFRDDLPPPAMAIFGSGACTNPAALGGGSAGLHAYLSTNGPGASSDAMAPWVDSGAEVTTPFVSVPGLLDAECVMGSAGEYLSITINGDPADPRTDTITGDVVRDGEIQAGWGLHLIDVHLAMGNLVDIVQAKAEALAAR